MLIRIILGAAVVLAMMAAPAEAASNAQWDLCSDVDNLDNADRNIAACNQIIEDRRTDASNRARALTYRCGHWRKKGQFDRAIEDCNQSFALKSRNADVVAETYNNRANAWRAKGEFDRALTDHNQAIRVAPKDDNAYDNRGFTLFIKSDFERAIADHNDAIRRNPKNDFAYRNRARTHLYAGAADKALVDINEAIKLNPGDAYHAIWAQLIGPRNNVPSRLPEANVLINTVKWPKPVIRLFLDELTPEALLAAANDPDPYKRQRQICEANFFTGWWALQRDDRQEAVRLFQTAANDCPFELSAWRAAREELRLLGHITVQLDKPGGPQSLDHLNRGDEWFNKGDFDRAIAEYTEAIRLDPKDAAAYNGRGSAWQAKGEYDLAIADFTEAIRFDPNYAPTYYLRGYVLNKKGEIDRAIVDFTEAIRHDPNYASAYYGRGIAQQAKGEFHRAVADLADAIRLEPKNPGAYYHRGRAQLYTGAEAQAMADLAEASELDPKNPYYALWVDIAGHRSKAPSRLGKAVTFLEKTQWPAPVIRMFLSQAQPAEVLAAANNPDPRQQAAQICEAHSYSGHWSLRQGNKQEAVQLFRLAANDCPRDVIEWGAARAELRALGQTP